MNSTPVVYISYSHNDQAFVDELLKFLRPFERTADFQVWHDRQIAAGTDWQQQISEALDSAAIAVLLVSADYLASEWINRQELPRLLERQQQGEIRLLPIIVRPAAWVHTPLAYFQVLPRDGRALSELSLSERDHLWTELTEVLIAAIHRLEKPSTKSSVKQLDSESEVGGPKPEETVGSEAVESPKSEARKDGSLFFISHAKEDGDFAENLKSRMSEAGFIGWIDIDVLEAGTDWRMEIDEAILNSRAVILILSPDSKASEYVTYEWAFGLGSGLRVVPLLLRDTPIHPRLEIFQYLDFTNRRARPWVPLFALLQELSDTFDTKEEA
jgi:TIR domain